MRNPIEQFEPGTTVMTHPTGLNIPPMAESLAVAVKALAGLGFTVGSLINGMQVRLATDDTNRVSLTIWAVSMMICAVYLFERTVSGGRPRKPAAQAFYPESR